MFLGAGTFPEAFWRESDPMMWMAGKSLDGLAGSGKCIMYLPSIMHALGR